MSIPEKQIEDYICENPQDIFMDKVIGRQIRLPHGILDILAVAGWQAFVIELKAVKLKESDVGQVLRYTYDVGHLLRLAGLHYYREWIGEPPVSQTFTDAEMRREWRLCIGYESPRSHESRRLVPYLVGKSVDEKVLSAAEAAGVEIYVWRHFPEDNSFAFDCEFMDRWRTECAYKYAGSPPFDPWVDKTLAHFVDPCWHEVNTHFDDFCNVLFGIEDEDVMPWHRRNHDR